MDFVDLRSPDILGLSFAIYKGRGLHDSRFIANIHAHLPGENLGFYREIEKKGQDRITWLYIPLGPQEVITEIWAKNVRKRLANPERPESSWQCWQLLVSLLFYPTSSTLRYS
jgi:hypothetical protein